MYKRVWSMMADEFKLFYVKDIKEELNIKGKRKSTNNLIFIVKK